MDVNVGMLENASLDELLELLKKVSGKNEGLDYDAERMFSVLVKNVSEARQEGLDIKGALDRSRQECEALLNDGDTQDDERIFISEIRPAVEGLIEEVYNHDLSDAACGRWHDIMLQSTYNAFVHGFSKTVQSFENLDLWQARVCCRVVREFYQIASKCSNMETSIPMSATLRGAVAFAALDVYHDMRSGDIPNAAWDDWGLFKEQFLNSHQKLVHNQSYVSETPYPDPYRAKEEI